MLKSHHVRIRDLEYRRRVVAQMNSLVHFGLMVSLNAEKVTNTILDGRCVDDYNDPNAILLARLVTPRLRGRNEVEGRWTRRNEVTDEAGVSSMNALDVGILHRV